MSNNLEIEIPVGNYDYKEFTIFCKRFGCEVAKKKRGDVYFKVSSDDAVNFFWLGCNLNFLHDTGISKSTASQIFKKSI